MSLTGRSWGGRAAWRLPLARATLRLALVVALHGAASAGEVESEPATARLTHVSVTRDAATRVEIKTTGAARYRTMWIESPSRLVVDFEDTIYGWRATPLDVVADPVKQVRGSQYRRDVARVVVEFTREVGYSIHEDPDGLSIVVRIPDGAPGREPGGVSDSPLERRAETGPSRAAPSVGGDTAPMPMHTANHATPSSPESAPLAGESNEVPEGPAQPPSTAPAPGTVPAAPAGPSAGSRSGIDLERLKDALARVPAEAGPPASASSPPREGQPLSLTLQQSIELALKKNLDVRVTRLSQESARLEVPKAWARYHPTVGFAATTSGAKIVPDGTAVTRENAQRLTPVVTEELPTGGVVILSTDFTRVETHPSSPSEEFGSGATVSIVQPLLKGGRIYVATKPIRDAEFDLRVAGEQLKAEILRVTARTKSSYYNVLLAEKVIEVTDAAIERDKALIEASDALFKARLVTKRDVFSAELAFAQDSARLVSARADLESAKNNLLEVLGLPIAADVHLVDQEIGFEPVPLELERWIATALKNRPEILSIAYLLAKSALNIRVAQNSLLPQLDLVASYGRAQTSSVFRRSLGLESDVWSAGLVVSFPVGNVAARSALQQAEIEHTSLREQLEQIKRQVELEVRAAVIKLRTSLERMKALTVAIDQAKGKLEVGKAQFALGQATNLDITDAQQSLLDAETDLLSAIVDYNIGLAELEAALGYVERPLLKERKEKE